MKFALAKERKASTTLGEAGERKGRERVRRVGGEKKEVRRRGYKEQRTWRDFTRRERGTVRGRRKMQRA